MWAYLNLNNEVLELIFWSQVLTRAYFSREYLSGFHCSSQQFQSFKSENNLLCGVYCHSLLLDLVDQRCPSISSSDMAVRQENTVFSVSEVERLKLRQVK